MIYLYRANNGKTNIMLEKQKGNKSELRLQSNGFIIPLLRCSNTKLGIIFSNITGKITNQTIRLEENDTREIVYNILKDEFEPYKPSSMMNYKVYTILEDNGFVTINFEVVYYLWKKVLNEESQHDTYQDIITDAKVYTYSLSPLEYLKLLILVNIGTESEALKMWEAYEKYMIIDDDDLK